MFIVFYWNLKGVEPVTPNNIELMWIARMYSRKQIKSKTVAGFTLEAKLVSSKHLIQVLLEIFSRF